MCTGDERVTGRVQGVTEMMKIPLGTGNPKVSLLSDSGDL